MEIVNTYHVPVPAMASASNAGFLAVMTMGDSNYHGGGDIAVYIGITGNLDVNAPDYDRRRTVAAEWIAYNGLKVNFEKARAYFPNLTEKEYRD